MINVYDFGFSNVTNFAFIVHPVISSILKYHTYLVELVELTNEIERAQFTFTVRPSSAWREATPFETTNSDKKIGLLYYLPSSTSDEKSVYTHLKVGERNGRDERLLERRGR